MDYFEKASNEVLVFLRLKLGFQMSMVTLKEGNDWTVLHLNDVGYGIFPGDVFKWSDSICSQMAKGNGPNVCANTSDVPAYLTAEIGSHIAIGAYVGVPLRLGNGRLFGTLCAFDPDPKAANLIQHQGLIQLLGTLLSIILQIELRADEEERKAERYQAQAMTDELTGLYNRAGWNHLIAKEESRYLRYRHSSSVVIVDLDGLKEINDSFGHDAGDAMIKKAALAIVKGARAEDIVARLGGDEFGIIGINCDREGGLALCERLKTTLEDEDVKASFGLAHTSNTIRLKDALTVADQAMYKQKKQKKTTCSESTRG